MFRQSLNYVYSLFIFLLKRFSPYTTDTSLPTTDTSLPTTDTSVPTTESSVPTTESSVQTTESSVPTTDTSSNVLGVTNQFKVYTPLVLHSKLNIILKSEKFGQKPDSSYITAIEVLRQKLNEFSHQSLPQTRFSITQTDEHSGDVVISFHNLHNDRLILIDDFLSGLGLQEFSENPEGDRFYNSQAGAQILSPSNYPDFLRNYLMEEGRLTEQFIRASNQYTALVEIGCGTGRAVWIGETCSLNYYGIDICKKDIEILNSKYQNHKGSKTIQGLHMSVFDLEKENPIPMTERPLYIFPFNVFGNIGKSLKLISLMKQLGADFIVTSYSTDKHASEIRQRYFEKCEFKNLTTEKNPLYIKFTSEEGLSSTAYNRNYFASLIEHHKMNVEARKFGDIGMMYLVTQSPKPSHTLKTLFPLYSQDDSTLPRKEKEIFHRIRSGADSRERERLFSP